MRSSTSAQAVGSSRKPAQRAELYCCDSAEAEGGLPEEEEEEDEEEDEGAVEADEVEWGLGGTRGTEEA